MLSGSLLAADEAAREDDTRHGEICCSKGGHYHPVSEYFRAKILVQSHYDCRKSKNISEHKAKNMYLVPSAGKNVTDGEQWVKANNQWQARENMLTGDERGNQSINQSVSQSVSQSINQSVNQSISQSVNQSIYLSINQSINFIN